MRSLAFVASVGARTALAPSASQTAFLLRTGVPAITASPLVDAEGEPVTMGFDATLDPYMVGEERAVALGAGALDEALAPLGAAVETLSLRLLLCLDERGGGAEVGRTADRIFAHARRRAPAMDLDICARGPASAAFDLPKALDMLAARRLDGVVLGGIHTDYDPAVIAALLAEGRLFTPENVDAVMPGEAAAFVVLLREDVARRAGLGSAGRICGVGSGVQRPRADGGASGFEATAMCAAVRAAAEDLVEEQLRAGWALLDLGFEVHRALEWQTTLVRTHAVWGSPYMIESPAQRLGRLGAAAMPLQIALAVEGWKGGYAPSGIAVALAGSEAGERGAIALVTNV